ncbi:MAG: sulfatase [Planctomycetes bacterium]|nr:sulfatase [Planctomycetota bacterium]
MLVIDAAHAHHLSCESGPEGLTPHIDALAARGRRFSRAYSNNTWTLPSTVSLFTGQLQESHGVVTNQHVVDDSLTLLPERFREAGYHTGAFVQNIYASSVHGLDHGFDDYHYYSITAGPHPYTAFGDTARWMDAHADERWFLYLHVRRPHSPYDPSPLALASLAPGEPLGSDPRDDDLMRADSRLPDGATDDERARIETLYRANLSTVDDDLADILRRAAHDPQMLVVLLSDHGEALGEHGHFGHGYQLDEENLHIPMVFAGPDVAPGVDDSPACTVDVTQTLVELCALRALPGPLAGTSLVPRLHGESVGDGRPIAISGRYNVGAVPRQGVLHGRLLLVLEADGTSSLRDLVDDPGGAHDLTDAHRDEAARLLDLAERRRESGSGLAERARVDMSTHDAELRALGYVR